MISLTAEPNRFFILDNLYIVPRMVLDNFIFRFTSSDDYTYFSALFYSFHLTLSNTKPLEARVATASFG